MRCRIERTEPNQNIRITPKLKEPNHQTEGLGSRSKSREAGKRKERDMKEEKAGSPGDHKMLLLVDKPSLCYVSMKFS